MVEDAAGGIPFKNAADGTCTASPGIWVTTENGWKSAPRKTGRPTIPSLPIVVPSACLPSSTKENQAEHAGGGEVDVWQGPILMEEFVAMRQEDGL
jgi:hypothetical protein